MIRCKRIYDGADQDDGYRVLVDRLWPRGIKKTELRYDEWARTLAPSTALRKALHGETIDFTEFSKRYREELNETGDAALALAKRARKETVTLLYGAKNTAQNHALVLADFLRQLKN
ncbi:DUF488 domain-containing protein [Enterobacter sp. R1(2018)]|uniref:DUF488 domain-containing protein n=1 Tax=Enterobacter sp. R1(2018) TaxID=2447891 RepID=UPI000EB3EBE4|nr:DUF488 family protein [Enterobacter sp. R1(2018)]RKQ39163.1 DUF488 family protein [Enterobacter sp. R1(2018)]